MVRSESIGPSKADQQQHADGTWKLSAYSILTRKIPRDETIGKMTVRSSVSMAPLSETVAEWKLSMEQAKVACEAGGKDVVVVQAKTLLSELPALRSDDPATRRSSIQKLREIPDEIEALWKSMPSTSADKKEVDTSQSVLGDAPKRYKTAAGKEDTIPAEDAIQKEVESFNKPFRGPLESTVEPVSPSPKSKRNDLNKTWPPGSPRRRTKKQFVQKPVYDFQKMQSAWKNILESGQGKAGTNEKAMGA